MFVRNTANTSPFFRSYYQEGSFNFSKFYIKLFQSAVYHVILFVLRDPFLMNRESAFIKKYQPLSIYAMLPVIFFIAINVEKD